MKEVRAFAYIKRMKMLTYFTNISKPATLRYFDSWCLRPQLTIVSHDVTSLLYVHSYISRYVSQYRRTDALIFIGYAYVHSLLLYSVLNQNHSCPYNIVYLHIVHTLT